MFDAIQLAYQTNPGLRAQQANLRSIDESYVEARSGYGPQIGVTGQLNEQTSQIGQPGLFGGPPISTNYRGNSGSADLSLAQPLFTGGATRARVQSATADILAGREVLRQTESQLLLNVVTAYVDVRLSRADVAIIADEITNLKAEFNETKAKGALGALTKTDVAQAEERLLSAEAQLSLAQGQVDISNAKYRAVVGQSPGSLDPEPDLAGMPDSVDKAFAAADHNNPQILQAVQNERSAREKVKQAAAARGPTVSVKVDAATAPYAPYLPHEYDRSVTASLVVSQTLFASGYNSAKIREAKDNDDQAELNIEASRRNVVQLIGQAWDQLVATRRAIAIEARQESVETTAVEGNRVEERVGSRSTIDLLNAELELADMRRSLMQSRHDEYVAEASLLSAMGLLEVRYLSPNTQTYDPQRSFNRVRESGAVPWEGVVATIDGLGAPTARPPRPSPPGTRADRPTPSPASAPTTP